MVKEMGEVNDPLIRGLMRDLSEIRDVNNVKLVGSYILKGKDAGDIDILIEAANDIDHDTFVTKCLEYGKKCIVTTEKMYTKLREPLLYGQPVHIILKS